MPTLTTAFASLIYRHELGTARGLVAGLESACRAVAAEDRAGRRWAAEHAYPGYTSYASLTDLPHRHPAFFDLQSVLDDHVATFARSCDMDLGHRRLELDSLWINILEPGGFHSAHIHPHSAVSGTVYVSVPKGASAIRFEDPRLPQMMSLPPRPRAQPHLPRHRSQARHASPLGKLSAPRRAAKPRPQRTHLGQLQLPLELIVRTRLIFC